MILLKKLRTSLSVVKLVFYASPFYTIIVVFWSALDALVLTMGTTLATGFFVDTTIEVLNGNRSYSDIYLPLCLLLLLLCFISTASSIISLLNERIALNIRRKIEPEIVKKFSSVKYEYIENIKIWELISRVSSDPTNSIMNGFKSFVSLFRIILYICSVLGSIILYVWWAAILVFLFSAPTLWLSIRAGRKNYEADLLSEIFNRRTQYLNELLIGRNNVNERLLYGYGDELIRRWQKEFEHGLKLKLKVRIKQLLLTRGSSLALSLIVVIVALMMIPPVISGHLSPGLFMGLIGAVIGVTHNMGWEMSSALESIAKTSEFMQNLTEFNSLDEIPNVLCEPDMEPLVFSSLEFRNVRFKYPNEDKYVLNGLSFKLENGYKYAFVGKNGAGKSTIIKLIAGLYTDYEGEILINDIELRKYPAGTIKALLSIVHQDFAKYYISIRENIALGDVSNRDSYNLASKFAELAGLNEIITKLKNGIDTPLGRIKKDGQDLSGGQWQKVAIARSLISRAPLKILDEPTASLDPISESQLYEEFRKLMENKTTIFISHRLGATKLADDILVIDNGHIIERGTHKSLMEMHGEYARMFEAQRSWYI